MTIETLEKRLKPLEAPLEGAFLKWLYLHLPPRPIDTKRLHGIYARAVSILLEAKLEGALSAADRRGVERYVRTVAPFVAEYEERASALKPATPEQMLEFLMDQHDLSQYDVAADVGGQPVVSDVLRGKRRLTREHIERLSARFRLSPAAFYPAEVGGASVLRDKPFKDRRGRRA